MTGTEEGPGYLGAKLSEGPKDYFYGAHRYGGSFRLSRVRERFTPRKRGPPLSSMSLGRGEELMPDSVTVWILVRRDHQVEDKLKLLLTLCINLPVLQFQTAKNPGPGSSVANECCHQSHCNFPQLSPIASTWGLIKYMICKCN